MRKRKPKINIHNNFKLVIKLAIIGLILYGSRQLYLYLFTIKHVSCATNTDEACPDSVIAEVGRLIDTNILFIESQQIREKIMGSSVIYTNIDVSKSLPGKVAVFLYQAEAIGQLKIASYSGYLVIMNNKTISESRPELTQNLPLLEINYVPSLQVGQEIQDDRIVGSIDLYQNLKTNFIDFDDFVIATDGAKLSLSSKQQVIFDPKKNIQNQIRALQIILINDLSPSPAEIDLRFDKPVLRY